jgi:pimeloyl-ACP methyl ester carboxylesterase
LLACDAECDPYEPTGEVLTIMRALETDVADAVWAAIEPLLPASVVDRIAVEFGEDLADLRTAHVHAASDDDWVRFLRQIAELWLTLPAYRDDQLATISDPTLVITGDRDELADIEQADRLYRAIPNAELAVVPGAGHGCADRDVYWSLVLDFVSRRQPAGAATDV